ncbi:MAG: HAD family acid phosphatase [Pseudomonadota bacterium]
MIYRRLLPISLLVLVLGGCAASVETDATPSHDNTDAVVWLQSSSEYAALTAGVYASATAALDAVIGAGDATKMAVVLDVDETVLDNSSYQGQLVLDNDTYGSETWDRWIALKAAVEVPGVVDFIRESQARGIHVVFITNRECLQRSSAGDVCPQLEETRANLESIGIDTAQTTLFLRGQQPPEPCRALLTGAEQAQGVWSSDKTSRRACVELDRQIVMLFGDQFGDFTEAHGTDGRVSAAEFSDNWGRNWFVLPNPTYGGWKPRSAAEKRALIRSVD